MNTETQIITVAGLDVEVVRKDIKNLHLGVYPPNGRVRVAIPIRLTAESARLAIVERLPWIWKQKQAFDQQDRESEREMISGESHYYLGIRYRLNVTESEGGRSSVNITKKHKINLIVPVASTSVERRRILDAWYRSALKRLLIPLVASWEKRLGVASSVWGVKKMKTKWGSCSMESRRVWFNLELIKKPHDCLEYVVVHELSHLIVRHHDPHFVALLDRHIPRWRSLRAELNKYPLSHDLWA